MGPQIKKEQICLFAGRVKKGQRIYHTSLADQLMDVLKDEKFADEALKKVSKNIKNAK